MNQTDKFSLILGMKYQVNFKVKFKTLSSLANEIYTIAKNALNFQQCIRLINAVLFWMRNKNFTVKFKMFTFGSAQYLPELIS